MCVTLVIYQESLHDARSTKYIISTILGFFCPQLNIPREGCYFVCLEAIICRHSSMYAIVAFHKQFA